MLLTLISSAYETGMIWITPGSFPDWKVEWNYSICVFLLLVVFVFFFKACGVWKKRCFETKKVTASLEEVLTKLREDLELYYKKLLMQLEVREIKMRPKNLANITDSKVLLNMFSFCCVWLLSHFSHAWLFATLWTAACQAPLSVGILQARILEWVAIPFSRGSSQPRDRTQVSCIAGRFYTVWASRKAPVLYITSLELVDLISTSL